jgi:Holliday junction resolvase RusA-like endonuclease
MIKFKVYGKPVPKGRPRFTRSGFAYTPKETREAEQGFLAQAIAFKPEKPFEKALKVSMIFSMIKPKSKPKKVKYWTTKPDLDNFIKLVDSMNGVFWVSDAQIVEISAKKIYGDSDYTEIEIIELEWDENDMQNLRTNKE